MEKQRELAKKTFVSGVNSAKKMALSSKDNDGFLVTVLADLMQIQCIKSGDTNLLRFVLPSAIDEIVHQIAKLQHVSAFTWSDHGGGVSGLVFKNEDEQDKFIEFFQMLSFRGQRAYPTPDIYLGQGNPDLPSSTLSPCFSLISRGGLHMNQSLSRGFLDFLVV